MVTGASLRSSITATRFDPMKPAPPVTMNIFALNNVARAGARAHIS
jgi:hypothetical protein